MSMMSPVPVRSLAAWIMTIALIAGCGTAPSPMPSTRPAATAGPTPSPTDFLPGAAAGLWRPAPLPVTPAFNAPLEAACREAEPEIDTLPTAVVDARGQGLATLVFADNTRGFTCRVALEAGDAAPDVQAVDVPPDPVGEEGIDILRYDLERATPGDTRTLMVGRVGSRGRAVLASFDDESEVRAAVGGGWYAMWWPSSTEAATVAAVNNAMVVIGDAVPSGPPSEP
jgi:hypothetical protein